MPSSVSTSLHSHRLRLVFPPCLSSRSLPLPPPCLSSGPPSPLIIRREHPSPSLSPSTPLFSCSLYLPAAARLPPVHGPLCSSSRDARRAVCLAAIQQLHAAGQLTDELLPVRRGGEGEGQGGMRDSVHVKGEMRGGMEGNGRGGEGGGVGDTASYRGTRGGRHGCTAALGIPPGGNGELRQEACTASVS